MKPRIQFGNFWLNLELRWIFSLKAVSDLNWKSVARPTTGNSCWPTKFGFVQLRQLFSLKSVSVWKIQSFRMHVQWRHILHCLPSDLTSLIIIYEVSGENSISMVRIRAHDVLRYVLLLQRWQITGLKTRVDMETHHNFGESDIEGGCHFCWINGPAVIFLSIWGKAFFIRVLATLWPGCCRLEFVSRKMRRKLSWIL